jgi:hypothetical protein
MTEIQWTLYPHVVGMEHAKAWVGIEKKLLRAPKTIDAYARGLNDFISVCKRLAVSVESATKGDIAARSDHKGRLFQVAPCTCRVPRFGVFGVLLGFAVS